MANAIPPALYLLAASAVVAYGVCLVLLASFRRVDTRRAKPS
jgi:hypothetical protein